MSDEGKITTLFLAILLSATFTLCGIIIGYRIAPKPTETMVEVHDTIRKTDTVKIELPKDTVVETKTKTVKVQLHDTVTLVDSVWVDLPFEQHHAVLDDVADIWYSGFQAKIDSATVYRYQETILETKYIEQSKRNIIAIEAGTRDASVLYLHSFGKVQVGFSAGTTYKGTATARGIIGVQF